MRVGRSLLAFLVRARYAPLRPSSLRARYAPLALCAGLLFGGCYSQLPPTQVAKLRVIAQPDSTTVYIDDAYVGKGRVLAKQPVALKPGVKFITFKAPDYFPHDVRVDLPPGETTIEMKLRPIPP